MFLSSCSTLTPNVVSYKSEPIEKPALVLPDVTVLELRDADFKIITPEELNDIFDKLKKDGEPVVIYALTTEGYSQLALNIGDILKLVSQQKAIIEAYKEYYEQTEKNINEHNSKANTPVESSESLLDKIF
jgi:ABC-type Fe3+-hydroxamate transport system substrate-binding protein